ncbi:MAG TPA: hypothetical protein VHP83_02100 [Aggregatilineaceae bacterium]|nr:hypothetical protein [Aggregatilineaceae bacterium]
MDKPKRKHGLISSNSIRARFDFHTPYNMDEVQQRLVERSYYPVHLGSFINIFGGDSGLSVTTQPGDWNYCYFTVHYQIENYRAIEVSGTLGREGSGTRVVGGGRNIGVMTALLLLLGMSCGVIFSDVAGPLLSLITFVLAIWYVRQTAQIRDRVCALIVDLLEGQPHEDIYADDSDDLPFSEEKRLRSYQES